MELLEPKEWMLEDLKRKEAMIIECPDYGNHTFIGIGQAFTSEGQPYPTGGCALNASIAREVWIAKRTWS